MNYGMYISASGAMGQLYRQDVLASNLANLNTAGFQQSLAALRQRDAARIEDGLSHLPSDRMLERLGAGVLASPTRLKFEQGPIERTDNPLDVAIRGRGFFLVQDSDEQGADLLRISRDGRLTRHADGTLVRVSDGRAVLDAAGRPIRLPLRGEVEIDREGRVLVDGEALGQLALVDVANPAGVRPVGEGLYAPNVERMSELMPAGGILESRSVEGSTVDPVRAMMQLTGAAKSAEANIGMIGWQDRLMERAINGLGKVG